MIPFPIGYPLFATVVILFSLRSPLTLTGEFVKMSPPTRPALVLFEFRSSCFIVVFSVFCLLFYIVIYSGEGVVSGRGATVVSSVAVRACPLTRFPHSLQSPIRATGVNYRLNLPANLTGVNLQGGW